MSNKNIFNSVQVRKYPKSVFDLSHDVKLSLNMGELVPVMCMETIPGDTINVAHEVMGRLAPMVSPIMHIVKQTVHTWFVPYRILWDNWNNFITNTKDPVSGLLPAVPTVTIDKDSGNYTRLLDYLGIPRPTAPFNVADETISVFPLAAYQLVFNQFYRDQNLNTSGYWNPNDSTPIVDGDNTAQIGELAALRQRAWMHDYFTAALPFAQKGDPVSVPGDIVLNPAFVGPGGPRPIVKDSTDYTAPVPGTLAGEIVTGELLGAAQDVVLDPNGSLVLSSTINDLRRAEKIQQWLELNARSGTRINENLLANFGVKSRDARLQLPEYINGSVQPFMISEVLNTSDTTDAPQGNMSGHGITVGSSGNGHYFCEEHGVIISLLSVLPNTAYMQGIERFWYKTDPTEFGFPIFANLGEQAIYNSELAAFQAADDQKDVFGYIPRYAEYKYMCNRVAGDFRTTLETWHMARKFAGVPALNGPFITSDPTLRIFAVTDPDTQHLYYHVFNKVRAVRSLPKFGTPML